MGLVSAMKAHPRFLAALFLGALAFAIAFSMIPVIWGFGDNSGAWQFITDSSVWQVLTRLSLSIAVVVGLISLIRYLFDFQASFEEPAVRPEASGSAFPYAGTSFVAVALLFILGLYIAAFLLVMAPPDTASGSAILSVLVKPDFQYMLVAFLAAGIGSSIATIYAYLRHASTLQDFDPAYIPWYFLRPVLGSLLGLVFYWLIRGSIIAILPAEQPNASSPDLDLNALAGVSALVGLFSRQAIQKLREIFHVLFVTQGNIPTPVRRKAESDLLNALPDDLRSKVKEHMKLKQAQKSDQDDDAS